jgi:hypothetical protein
VALLLENQRELSEALAVMEDPDAARYVGWHAIMLCVLYVADDTVSLCSIIWMLHGITDIPHCYDATPCFCTHPLIAVLLHHDFSIFAGGSGCCLVVFFSPQINFCSSLKIIIDFKQHAHPSML